MTRSKKTRRILSLVALLALFMPLSSDAIESYEGIVGDTTEVTVSVICPGGVCAVNGCTDPSASNYSAAATVDDGTCQYPPVVTQILGCTDPAAINFNARATTDNGSCRYSVPNVGNFAATESNGAIRLSWTKPAGYARFASVIIVRGTNIPTSINSGEQVYEGTGTSFVDPNITPGVRYYYLAVVRSLDESYSSGALTNFRIGAPLPPPVEPPPVGPELPPPPGGDGGSGGSAGGGAPGPFSRLPFGFLASSSAERLAQIPYLFVVLQPGERAKPIYEKGYLKVKGNKTLTFSVDYRKMPEVLKTIGVTLYPSKRPDLSFSFILSLNKEKTAYEATIDALPEDDVYRTSIYLINYEDQTIRYFSSEIAAVGSLGFLGAGGEKFVRQVAGPVAVTGGAAAGLFQLLFAGGGTFSELYLLLLRQLGAVLGFFGIKKKNRPWGTVYDSITKRPIDPAYVSVFSAGEEVGTAITDIDGRYGFSLLDGFYNITAAKTHYRFPSTMLAGQTQDAMYSNLYFGEPFHAGPGEVISKNIPLDPIDFDWNEFVKQQGRFSELFKKREVLRAKITSYLYNAGFFFSLVYLIFWPGIFNILVLALYLAIYFVGRYHRAHHHAATVKNLTTNEPVSFAIIHIYYADLGQEVKKVVTDMIGRFYLLLRPGTYYLTVDHKQPDGTYARIYESPPTFLPKGIWDKDILI